MGTSLDDRALARLTLRVLVLASAYLFVSGGLFGLAVLAGAGPSAIGSGAVLVLVLVPLGAYMALLDRLWPPIAGHRSRRRLPWGHPSRDVIAVVIGYQVPALVATMFLIPSRGDLAEFLVPLTSMTRVTLLLGGCVFFQMCGLLLAPDTLRSLVAHVRRGDVP